MVQVLTSGKKTCDLFLAACSRNVWQVAASRDIDITYVHVLGKNNTVADLLSRWSYSHADNLQLSQYVPALIWVPVSLQSINIDPNI